MKRRRLQNVVALAVLTGFVPACRTIETTKWRAPVEGAAARARSSWTDLGATSPRTEAQWLADDARPVLDGALRDAEASAAFVDPPREGEQIPSGDGLTRLHVRRSVRMDELHGFAFMLDLAARVSCR